MIISKFSLPLSCYVQVIGDSSVSARRVYLREGGGVRIYRQYALRDCGYAPRTARMQQSPQYRLREPLVRGSAIGTHNHLEHLASGATTHLSLCGRGEYPHRHKLPYLTIYPPPRHLFPSCGFLSLHALSVTTMIAPYSP